MLMLNMLNLDINGITYHNLLFSFDDVVSYIERIIKMTSSKTKTMYHMFRTIIVVLIQPRIKTWL